MSKSAFRVATRAVPSEFADPLAFLGLAPTSGPRFFWSAPDDDTTLVAFGATLVAVGEGPDRLAQVANVVHAAAQEVDGPVGPTDLRWLGGFAFDELDAADARWQDFPPAWFVLPEALLTVSRTGAELTVTHPADDGRDPVTLLDGLVNQLVASSMYRAQDVVTPDHVELEIDSPTDTDVDESVAALRVRIEQAVAAIARGEVSKVVVSTARVIRATEPFDPLVVLARQKAAQPGCFHFLVSPRPGLALVGASPERLVRIAGNRLSTMALAGSARRDPDPARDQALGAELLANAKDRAEHALVVAAIRDALNGYLIEAPGEPRLRRLATIQHLETRIEAELPGQGGILAEVARLHPTPALGGSPREAALPLIRMIERTGRGWYGGAVGWIDGQGNGDLAVVIRSILLRNATATAFAGAGIVAGSDVEAEVQEMDLKLASVLGGLGCSRHDAGSRSPEQSLQ